MALSTIAYYALLVVMYRWYPTGDDETLAILVVISVFWGLAVACFNVTTNSNAEYFFSILILLLVFPIMCRYLWTIVFK